MMHWENTIIIIVIIIRYYSPACGVKINLSVPITIWLPFVMNIIYNGNQGERLLHKTMPTHMKSLCLDVYESGSND